MDEEDLAELWGVDIEEVSDLLEAIGEDPDTFEVDATDFEQYEEDILIPEFDDGVPDPDYMQWLAEELDFDISDLYDMYYYGEVT